MKRKNPVVTNLIAQSEAARGEIDVQQDRIENARSIIASRQKELQDLKEVLDALAERGVYEAGDANE